MGVNKSVLEKMSSKELEKYVDSESKFVPEAIEYAFEILKERGYQFNESELERWNSLKQKNIELSEKEIHPNYRKASYLWYLSVGFGILNFLLLNWNYFTEILTTILTFITLLVIGVLISKGFDWMKYFLLVIGILGLLLMIPSLSVILVLYLSNPIIAIINIIQTILQIWVLVILFRIPKNT